jgi:hypothetical protein
VLFSNKIDKGCEELENKIDEVRKKLISAQQAVSTAAG